MKKLLLAFLALTVSLAAFAQDEIKQDHKGETYASIIYYDENGDGKIDYLKEKHTLKYPVRFAFDFIYTEMITTSPMTIVTCELEGLAFFHMNFMEGVRLYRSVDEKQTIYDCVTIDEKRNITDKFALYDKGDPEQNALYIYDKHLFVKEEK